MKLENRNWNSAAITAGRLKKKQRITQRRRGHRGSQRRGEEADSSGTRRPRNDKLRVISEYATGRLSKEVEQGRQAEDSSRGVQGGLIGGLGLREIGCDGSKVRTNQGVLLSAQIEFVLVQKVLAEIDLI